MAKKKSKYYVRPDGLHEASRVINGKRVVFRGRTDREVEQKMLAYQEKQEIGALFGEVADEWWEEKQEKLAVNSLKNYAPAYRRAAEHFREVPLRSITPAMADAFISGFAKQGYAKKTVSTQLLVLHLIFDYAVLHGQCATNAAESVKVPSGLKKTHRMPPTEAEEKNIKRHRFDSAYFIGYLIIMTGMRFGEVMGLRFEDIDLDRMEISINRSVYYISTVPNTKIPKTAKSFRTVPILNGLLEVLQKRYPKMPKSGYLFCEPDGGLLYKSRAQKLYSNFRKASGVTVTAHQLRHGYATAVYEAGIDMKVAQQLLGHAQISTTADIYTAIRQKQIQKAVKKLNKTL